MASINVSSNNFKLTIKSNDAISLKIDMKSEKPEVDVSNATKRRRLECSVCLQGMDDQNISTTKCGHMFCTACIKEAIRRRKACPLCNGKVLLEDLRRTYLPDAK